MTDRDGPKPPTGAAGGGPGATPPARSFPPGPIAPPNLAVGDELAPLVKELTLERLIAYGGPAKNFHSDLEAARAEGFPSVVAWGMLSVSFVSELFGAHFGLGWARGGRLAVSLIKPVFAGDTLTVRAHVTNIEPNDAETRYHFDVWCENPRGEKVLAGTASARAAADL